MHMKKYLTTLFGSLFFAALVVAAIPQAMAQQPLPPRKIGPKLHCPVCGMYPARYPEWRAEIIFKDGLMTAFDSPGDLFQFLQHMPHYDRHHSANDISATYVTDYVTGTWENAKHAYFVSGSSVNGPMGKNLPAFANRAEARKFIAKAGGTMLTFDQITPMIIMKLQNGGMKMDKSGEMKMHNNGGMKMNTMQMNH